MEGHYWIGKGFSFTFPSFRNLFYLLIYYYLLDPLLVVSYDTLVIECRRCLLHTLLTIVFVLVATHSCWQRVDDILWVFYLEQWYPFDYWSTHVIGAHKNIFAKALIYWYSTNKYYLAAKSSKSYYLASLFVRWNSLIFFRACGQIERLISTERVSHFI